MNIHSIVYTGSIEATTPLLPTSECSPESFQNEISQEEPTYEDFAKGLSSQQAVEFRKQLSYLVKQASDLISLLYRSGHNLQYIRTEYERIKLNYGCSAEKLMNNYRTFQQANDQYAMDRASLNNKIQNTVLNLPLFAPKKRTDSTLKSTFEDQSIGRILTTSNQHKSALPPQTTPLPRDDGAIPFNLFTFVNTPINVLYHKATRNITRAVCRKSAALTEFVYGNLAFAAPYALKQNFTAGFMNALCETLIVAFPHAMNPKHALVLTSDSDWDGSFQFDKKNIEDVITFKQIEGMFDVTYRRFGDVNSFCKAIDEHNARIGAPELLVIRGHGSQEGISLLNGSLDIHTTFPARSCLNNLSSKATIVIESCSVAEGSPLGENNFADHVLFNSPEGITLFAPFEPTCGVQIFSEEPLTFQFLNLQGRDTTYVVLPGIDRWRVANLHNLRRNYQQMNLEIESSNSSDSNQQHPRLNDYSLLTKQTPNPPAPKMLGSQHVHVRNSPRRAPRNPAGIVDPLGAVTPINLAQSARLIMEGAEKIYDRVKTPFMVETASIFRRANEARQSNDGPSWVDVPNIYGITPRQAHINRIIVSRSARMALKVIEVPFEYIIDSIRKDFRALSHAFPRTANAIRFMFEPNPILKKGWRLAASSIQSRFQEFVRKEAIINETTFGIPQELTHHMLHDLAHVSTAAVTMGTATFILRRFAHAALAPQTAKPVSRPIKMAEVIEPQSLSGAYPRLPSAVVAAPKLTYASKKSVAPPQITSRFKDLKLLPPPGRYPAAVKPPKPKATRIVPTVVNPAKKIQAQTAEILPPIVTLPLVPPKPPRTMAARNYSAVRSNEPSRSTDVVQEISVWENNTQYDFRANPIIPESISEEIFDILHGGGILKYISAMRKDGSLTTFVYFLGDSVEPTRSACFQMLSTLHKHAHEKNATSLLIQADFTNDKLHNLFKKSKRFTSLGDTGGLGYIQDFHNLEQQLERLKCPVFRDNAYIPPKDKVSQNSVSLPNEINPTAIAANNYSEVRISGPITPSHTTLPKSLPKTQEQNSTSGSLLKLKTLSPIVNVHLEGGGNLYYCTVMDRSKAMTSYIYYLGDPNNELTRSAFFQMMSTLKKEARKSGATSLLIQGDFENEKLLAVFQNSKRFTSLGKTLSAGLLQKTKCELTEAVPFVTPIFKDEAYHLPKKKSDIDPTLTYDSHFLIADSLTQTHRHLLKNGGTLQFHSALRPDESIVIFIEWIGDYQGKTLSAFFQGLSIINKYATGLGAKELFLQWHPHNLKLLEKLSKSKHFTFLGNHHSPIQIQDILQNRKSPTEYENWVTYPVFKLESYQPNPKQDESMVNEASVASSSLPEIGD